MSANSSPATVTTRARPGATRAEALAAVSRVWTTREDLRIAIVTWTERTYHRRQYALGRLTPIEYEIIMTTPTAQVA